MTPLMIALLPLLAANESIMSRPDFRGTWERVDAEPEVPTVAATGDVAFRSGTMGSGWGSPLTIRLLSGGTLVVEYPHFSAYDLQPPIRLIYELNGSESHNSVMIGHTTTPQRSRVVWGARELVITTEFPAPVPGAHVKVRQMLTLESPETLVVETIRDFEGASPSVTWTKYAKRQKPVDTPAGSRD